MMAVALALGLAAAPCGAIAHEPGTALPIGQVDLLESHGGPDDRGERTVTTRAGLDRPGRAPCERREGAIHAHTK